MGALVGVPVVAALVGVFVVGNVVGRVVSIDSIHSTRKLSGATRANGGSI